MTAALLGLGTAVPGLRIDRRESIDTAAALCVEDADQAPLLASLYRQSGVESRHIAFDDREFRRIVHGEGDLDSPFVSKGPGDRGPSTAERMCYYEQRAAPLATRAAHEALERSGVRPGEVTHLVTVSCTGFSAPGVDFELIRALGLAPTVERTLVGFMGCHGALNGLRVARGLVAAEPRARVLLCAVELCSLHYAYGWDPKKMVGNALFADGAAAVVLGPGSSGPPGAWRLAASGACLFPDSADAMAWHIRDHGFEMVLSTRVPRLIGQHLRPWLSAWLDREGLAIGDVASWAVHPGGPRVLNCVRESLEVAADATEVSRSILESHGNMSSATVLFIIDELMKRRAPLPCVALGFGPGLAAEGALFR